MTTNIQNNTADTIQKAIPRGDDVFHLKGTADDESLYTDIYDLLSSFSGVVVGQDSDVDRFDLRWVDPTATNDQKDSAIVSPGAPITFRLPPSYGGPPTVYVLSGRAVNTTALATFFGGAVPAPTVELWFALKPGLSLPQKRSPKFTSATVGAPNNEELIDYLFCYGRKTLFASINNPGANAVTARLAGLNLIDGVAKETTLGTISMIAAGTGLFNRSVDDSFDMFLLYLDGPSAAPGVSYRLEVRD